MKSLIIIPTYNERENIEPLLESIFLVEPNIRVQIVDDSSPDGTAEQVIKAQEKYPNLELFLRKKKEGLGAAYIDAFKKVISERPEIETIIMMDADLTHDAKTLPAFLEKIKENDFVIGSSLMDKEGRASYPWYRNIFSWFANFYCQLIFREKLTDWTNAYMIVKKDVLKQINLEDIGAREYAFVFGLKYALLKSGFKGEEVSSASVKRQRGHSKIRLSTIFEAVLVPWKLRNRF